MNIVRLSIGINFALFLYEILVLPADAVKLATELFNNAMDHIDSIDPGAFSDVNILIQQLRDNLTLWSSSLSHVKPESVPESEPE